MKKKAYTLTELLVVVMIIAVLAAVVLPKFNKVLETRKTTEAEDLMTAIRQEQEYRCAADHPYTDNMANLKSIASAKAKNYTLALTGTGVEAKRNGKSYQLSIPSYADGRICCDDINDSGLCAELNRDYPTCTELRAKADFKTSPDECVLLNPLPTPQCTNGAKEYADCTNSCGMSGTRLVNECVGGVWQARNGSCSVTDAACSCNAVSGDKPADREEQCSTCGTRTVTYNCSGAPNWQWVPSAGACSRTEDQCDCDPNTKPATSQSCGCGYTQTRTVECDRTEAKWVILNNDSGLDSYGWTQCQKPSGTKQEKCGEWLQTGTSINGQMGCMFHPIYATYTWKDEPTCDWVRTTDQSCCTTHGPYCNESTNKRYTWNYSTCQYEESGSCSKNSGDGRCTFTMQSQRTERNYQCPAQWESNNEFCGRRLGPWCDSIGITPGMKKDWSPHSQCLYSCTVSDPSGHGGTNCDVTFTKLECLMD